ASNQVRDDQNLPRAADVAQRVFARALADRFTLELPHTALQVSNWVVSYEIVRSWLGSVPLLAYAPAAATHTSNGLELAANSVGRMIMRLNYRIALVLLAG